MIYVDAAVGSGDLVAPLIQLGLPVTKRHLKSADVWFEGRGVKGAPLRIGIEVKNIGDLVSSLQTERLQGHQLLKMAEQYDRSYLIVEGDFGHDTSGKPTLFKKRREKGSRKVYGEQSAVELEKRLFNIQTRGGLITRHVPTRRDVHRVILAWYRYWTDKDLDQHKSHLAMYAPDMDPILREPISTFRYIVAKLPGIGYKRSAAVEEYFGGSYRAMMKATELEWSEIMSQDDNGKWRRIGPAKAKEIVKELQQ